MKIQEYFELCKVTDKKLTDENQNIIHYVLGMCGEFFSEILTDDVMSVSDRNNAVKELGDFMWYYACYCNSKNVIPTLIESKSSRFLPNTIGEIAEYEKKRIFYEREENQPLVEDLINLVYTQFTKLLGTLNITNEEVYQTNINKLKARYPDGFSVKHAEAKLDETKIAEIDE